MQHHNPRLCHEHAPPRPVPPGFLDSWPLARPQEFADTATLALRAGTAVPPQAEENPRLPREPQSNAQASARLPRGPREPCCAPCPIASPNSLASWECVRWFEAARVRVLSPPTCQLWQRPRRVATVAPN